MTLRKGDKRLGSGALTSGAALWEPPRNTPFNGILASHLKALGAQASLFEEIFLCTFISTQLLPFLNV